MLHPVLKKTRNVLLGILTFGASLTLGLLSFSGMFAIWPIIPLALATFILAVAYEGEIFWQNIKAAFNTLFGRQALRRQLLREFLADHVPENDDSISKLPILLQDYLKRIQTLHNLEHYEEELVLSAENKLYKKKLKDRIKQAEIDFAKHLLDLERSEDDLSEDEKDLRQWFKDKGGVAFKRTHYTRVALFTVGKVVSVLAGVGVCFGTAYLLFDTFMTIPFLAMIPGAALPGIILSMAAVSGIAYAMITYNSITAMLNNRTIQKVFSSLKEDVNTKGFCFSNVLKIVGLTFFILLTIALTVCTAGTWWTIGQNLSFIIQKGWLIGCTVFLTLSTLVINLFNTFCTWLGIKGRVEASVEEIEQEAAEANKKEVEGTQPNDKAAAPKQLTVYEKIKGLVAQGWTTYKASWTKPLNERDNFIQRNNPFRILIKILLIPLDWILFIAHVISIGVGGDQVPGVPQAASAAIGATADLFEDYERIVPHGHCHAHHHSVKSLLVARSESGGGHEHTLDLPRRCIQILLTPLYLIAILIDFFAMLTQEANLNWGKAWMLFKAACVRQYTDKDPRLAKEDNRSFYAESKQPEHSVSLATEKLDAKRYIHALEDRLDGPARDSNKAQAKIEKLRQVEKDIEQAVDNKALKTVLEEAAKDQVISAVRFSIFEPAPETKSTTAKRLASMYDEMDMAPVVAR